MIAYSTDELISSSDFAKKFGNYLSKITTNTLEKIAILKNNKVEAVLISKDEYEKMKEALDLVEHQEIYNIVKQRKESKTISFEDITKKHNIELDELK